MIPDYQADDGAFYRFPVGPHLWEVCDACGRGGHMCRSCGDGLRHDGRSLDGTLHPCLVDVAFDDLTSQLDEAELTMNVMITFLAAVGIEVLPWQREILELWLTTDDEGQPLPVRLNMLRSRLRHPSGR